MTLQRLIILLWLGCGSALAQPALAQPALAQPALAQPAPAQPSAGEPIEAFWPRQVAAVEAAVATLPAERPGVTDLFVLAVAGDGQQAIFEREAEFARRVLATRYRAEARTLLLGNGPSPRPGRLHASHVTLRAALGALAARMNLREDVLVLFMTSHGEQTGPFVLAQPGLRLKSLTPTELSAMLAEFGLERRLVIISACHSGAFVPALAGPDSALFTAAARDQSSFGCSDDRDLTYFGEAFLRRTLPGAASIDMAFARARQLITAWELAGDLPASLPQRSVGARIGEVLEALDRSAVRAAPPPLSVAECPVAAPSDPVARLADGRLVRPRPPCPPPAR